MCAVFFSRFLTGSNCQKKIESDFCLKTLVKKQVDRQARSENDAIYDF